MTPREVRPTADGFEVCLYGRVHTAASARADAMRALGGSALFAAAASISCALSGLGDLGPILSAIALAGGVALTLAVLFSSNSAGEPIPQIVTVRTFDIQIPEVTLHARMIRDCLLEEDAIVLLTDEGPSNGADIRIPLERGSLEAARWLQAQISEMKARWESRQGDIPPEIQRMVQRQPTAE